MFLALFKKITYLTLILTFDLELWQKKSLNQKRPLLKILHLGQVSFVPSGIILLQNAVGGLFRAVNLSTNMLIPNLPHAKLYFQFFPFKIAKQNGHQNSR